MSDVFYVTSSLLIFVSAATAGDGHSPQVAAVHAVLACCYLCDGAGSYFKDMCYGYRSCRVLFSVLLTVLVCESSVLTFVVVHSVVTQLLLLLCC